MGFQTGTIQNSGYDFAGDYVNKGCYVYLYGGFEGLSFYGTNGTVEQMQQSLQNPMQRPQGYDCNGEKNFKFKSCLFISLLEPTYILIFLGMFKILEKQ